MQRNICALPGPAALPSPCRPFSFFSRASPWCLRVQACLQHAHHTACGHRRYHPFPCDTTVPIATNPCPAALYAPNPPPERAAR